MLLEGITMALVQAWDPLPAAELDKDCPTTFRSVIFRVFSRPLFIEDAPRVVSI